MSVRVWVVTVLALATLLGLVTANVLTASGLVVHTEASYGTNYRVSLPLGHSVEFGTYQDGRYAGYQAGIDDGAWCITDETHGQPGWGTGC